MNKQKGLRIVNIVMFILIVWLVLTAVLHEVFHESMSLS